MATGPEPANLTALVPISQEPETARYSVFEKGNRRMELSAFVCMHMWPVSFLEAGRFLFLKNIKN